MGVLIPAFSHSLTLGGGRSWYAGGTAPGSRCMYVVSWARDCGLPDFPGVYTRVMSYISWINSYVLKFPEPPMGPDEIHTAEETPATHFDPFTPPSGPTSLS